ncbi:type II toxin-antitoxin system VapC family toxin [Sphaerisporangium sp. NPDC088356]|uniref:type II toxin-antitoxin system VapC family toxin n=1 Tax=Sphaerisporangium sp. NPDC088356 TaxID=3154871 RepID=UPI00343AA39B
MTVATRGLLDTNILILMEGLDQRELPLEQAISAITLAELSAGPLATDDPQEQAGRQDILTRAESEFEPIPFDTAAARAFGRVYAAVLAAGRNPRRNIADLLIASIAVANRLPLYTVNPDDFKGLEHLVRVEPVTHPQDRPHSGR